jgi:hypothetical protein
MIKPFKLFAVALLLTSYLCAQAAPVMWQAPVFITSADQALKQGSSVVYAAAWTGRRSATTVTLADASTVTFQSGTINGTGVVQVTGAVGLCGSNCAAYNRTSNAAFNSVMGGFAYDGTHEITLTGLTIGANYLVQLFAVDDRTCCTHKRQTFSDEFGNSTATYFHNTNSFVLGNFTAGAITQKIFGFGNTAPNCSGGRPCSNLNAVVLYRATVPEPASLSLAAVALLGLVATTRMRKRG